MHQFGAAGTRRACASRRGKSYAYQHWKAHLSGALRPRLWFGAALGTVLVARHDAQIEVEARHLVEEERNVFRRARAVCLSELESPPVRSAPPGLWFGAALGRSSRGTMPRLK